jgi:hypothetical protein
MESKNPEFQLLHFLLQVSKADTQQRRRRRLLFLVFSVQRQNQPTNSGFFFPFFFSEFCGVAKTGTIKKTKGKIMSNLAIP